MRRLLGVAAFLMAAPLVSGPAAAAPAPAPTVVVHNTQETINFPDDRCGPRANTTTFFRKIVQVRFAPRPDGSFSYREVAVVTYVSDYVDPALPTLTGRLTEINHFRLTPGGTSISHIFIRDFFGDVRIVSNLRLVESKGEIRVERVVDRVTGCP